MPQKNSHPKIHSNHKTVQRRPAFYVLLLILSIILLFDGFLRIFLSISLIHVGNESIAKIYYYLGSSVPMEQGIKVVRGMGLRWFLIGSFEVVCAYGILKMKKWALFTIGILSLVRIYTIFAFPPRSFIIPLQQNAVFYVAKIVVLGIAAYLFTKRKVFH